MVKQNNSNRPKAGQTMAGLMLLLILASLACSLGRSKSSEEAIRIGNALPTFTATAPIVSLADAAPADALNANQQAVDGASAGQSPGNNTNSAQTAPSTSSSGQTTANRDASAAGGASARGAQPQAGTQPGFQPPNRSVIIPTATSTPLFNGSPLSADDASPTPASQPTSTPSPVPTATATLPFGLSQDELEALLTATPVSSGQNPAPSAPVLPAPDFSGPAANPIPNPINRPASTDWSFIGVRTVIDEGDALVVGELVNNTGVPQSDIRISTILYNQWNKVIVNQVEILDHIPVDIVPARAHIPFELMIESEESIYRLDLVATSSPVSDTPRQSFKFSGVTQWKDEAGLYCLGGRVQNDAPLEEYLIILATTYDRAGQVISFGEHASGSPERILGGETAPFEICIDSLGYRVAHHQLKALGL